MEAAAKLRRRWFILLGVGIIVVAANLMPERDAQTSAASARTEIPTAVVIACRDAVRANAMHPSKADFFLLTTETGHDETNGAFVIRGRVDLMNGLGAMTPHTYSCLVNKNHAVSLRVTPGA